jgi:hypothetical protein
MNHRPYILHLQRPAHLIVGLVLVLTLLGLGARYWYQSATSDQAQELRTLKQNYKALEKTHEQLTEKNRLLVTELENAKHAYALLAATDKQLQQDLQSVQDDVMRVNKELLFYQNITQGNASSELQVRELRIMPGSSQLPNYNYRIVLTQGKKITKSISGDVVMELLYSDGHTEQVEVTQSLNIRHVQVVEGPFQLKTDEHPSQIRIRLVQKKKTLSESTFNWDSVLSPST